MGLKCRIKFIELISQNNLSVSFIYMDAVLLIHEAFKAKPIKKRPLVSIVSIVQAKRRCDWSRFVD